jgi:PAS domain S-box-containing protein
MSSNGVSLGSRSAHFLAGGGECGARLRDIDWTRHSLGAPEQWSQSLRVAIRLMLSSQQPMFLWWGPELSFIYNDAHSRLIGTGRHPRSLGRPGHEVWAEMWDILNPQIQLVLKGQGATWHENQLVPILRDGHLEDAYWTYGFSPIDDETAPHGVGGVLGICAETTGSVQQRQRLDFMLKFTDALLQEPADMRAVIRIATDLLSRHLKVTHISFGEIYEAQEPSDVYYINSDGQANSVFGLLDQFGRTFARDLKAGRPVAICDVAASEHRNLPLVAATHTRSLLCVPVKRDERNKAIFLIQHIEPRRWRADEIALLEEAGERLWTLLKRGQAEKNLANAKAENLAALSAAQEELARMAERAEIAQFASRSTLYDYSPRTGVVFQKTAKEPLGGYGNDAIPATQEAWQQLIHPEDLSIFVQAVQQALEKADRFEVEYRVRHRDGHFIWVRDAGLAVRDQAGDGTRLVGSIRDVTQRKSVELSARAQADELKAIYDGSPVGLCILDRDLRYVRINDRLAEINGVPAADHIGKTVRDVVPDLDEQAVETLKRVLAGEAVYAMEFVGMTPAQPGVVRTWRENWLPLRGRDGDIAGVTVSAEEITEEKVRIEELAAQEALLQAIGKSSPDAIYAKDREGRMIYANAAQFEILTKSPDQVIGHTAHAYIDAPDEAKHVHETDMRVITCDQTERLDETFTLPDGSLRIFESTKAPLRTAEGSVAGIVAISKDVTERRTAEVRQTFLLELADRLRTDPRATEITAEALGRHFGVSRAGYAIADPTGETLTVSREYVDGTVKAATGEHHLAEFGSWLQADLRAGHTVVINDVMTDVRTAGGTAPFFAIAARSAISVPVIQEGRLVATVYLDHCEPRKWRADEIALVEEVAERAWAAVEREKTETALRLRTAELESLLVSAPLGVAFFDRDHRYLRINEELAAVNGVPSEQHIGRHIEKILPINAVSVVPLLNQVFATGDIIRNIEVVGETPRWPGEQRHWLTSYYPVRGVRGEITAVGVWVVDITDRQEAAAQLQRSELRLQLGKSVAGLGLATMNYQEDTITLDARAAELFDLPPDVPLPRSTVHARFHPDDADQLLPRIATLVGPAGEDFFAADHRVVHRSGEVRWISARKRMARASNANGQRIAVSGMLAVQDVTSLKEVEEALRKSEAALLAANSNLEHKVEQRTQEAKAALAQLFESQKMETIGQLTGGVAHDFNNLLSAILSNLDLLRKRITDPRATKLLDGAILGAERGAALTKRLLAFARRQDLKAETVQISALFEGMRDLLIRSLGPGVQIVSDLPADLPPVSVDPNQLELAILNLAVNARDAMPLGGSLTVEANADEIGANRHVEALAPGSYARLRVSDTGQGMDEATLKNAAQPFFTTKGVGRGTGLGLSMVQGLVAQSGGAMRIESQVGRGTTIELWLPRATVGMNEKTKMPYVAASGELQPPRTILVVDDDALVSMGTAGMLEDLGHRVFQANSGRAALELFGKHPDIDVVITDHAMPGMTGVELARRIHEVKPNLPIVLATGYAELPNSEDPGLPRLPKPFRQEDLNALISRVAEEKEEGSINVLQFRR